jgi:hypothetical protein
MRTISNCLNKQLSDLCQRSFQLEELSHKITLFLPKELADVCKVGSFNKGCLVLTTTDSAWASQLRYALPDLRDKLRKEAGMYQLTSIKITLVDALITEKKIGSKKSPILSEKAKANIISESEQCSYQPLKKALMHLADG